MFVKTHDAKGKAEMSNSDYKYKISVVIPVYNCEAFIKKCVKSLMNQSMPSKHFQIVFVNDGSTDNSGEVCSRLAEKYDNIVYFEKENGGVSTARNKGMELAQGKYILFLDSDDTISSNTLLDIYKFFEKHYDEVDLVTYTINYLNEKGVVTSHKRFDILDHTGVYDINCNYNLLQTTMNVCVKNVPENERILFDEELTLGEDQWFIYSWLLKKEKIGFVKDAVYVYYRHSNSASSLYNNPYYCFDQYVAFMRKVLNAKRDENGKAHPTAQSMIIYNLSWRLAADMLVSHIDEETEKKQMEILEDILSEIDIEIIANSYYIEPYHIEYFVRMKKRKFELAFNNSRMSAYCSDCLLFSQTFAVFLNRLTVRNGKCHILGYVRNGVVDYKDLTLYYLDNDNNLNEIPMSETTYSYHKSKCATNRFGGFDFSVDLDEVTSIAFRLKVGEDIVSLTPFFGFRCMVNSQKNLVACGEYTVEYLSSSGSILITKADKESLEEARKEANRKIARIKKRAAFYRIHSEMKSEKNEEIWLYCDREGILDNGYYQFIHDFGINDGVKRYYVYDKLKNKSAYFTSEQRKNLVRFKSIKHKNLFMRCSKILSSFNSLSIFSPFGGMPLKWYSDIARFELIYLQHGILHARLPLLYSKERANVDKVVISSEFERKNFTEIYNFKDEDLIMSGMPRFDAIDLKAQPKRKLLYSPSWRKNLIGEYVNNTRELMPEKFLASDYYKETSSFLNSPELAELLEEYDLELDFQNHPIFKDYEQYFVIDNPRIHVTREGEMQDYLMMITDYSSIVFDFVYLQRPIAYFVPDYTEFRAGITHNYNKLDLPLEEGFGDIAQTGDELIEIIKRIAENGFRPHPPYKKRMADFFESREKNHCSRLYEALKKSE